MPDQQLNTIIAAAIERIAAEMRQTAPYMADQVFAWMQQLARSDRPADYFTHPVAFPMLLLPWWLEQAFHEMPDRAFQADLIYSTINGYYFIRLLDNVMDDHATVEHTLLPAAGFFHTQFQSQYQRYFPYSHPFWKLFTAVWFHSGDATIKDAALATLDRDTFIEVAAQKVSAAKIPLAAVCYRYEQPERIELWSRFIDLLGCWHQMFNDLFGWHKDLARATPTYFLSEAERRRDPTEPVAAWVVREGFAWGMQSLTVWMAEAKTLAGQLHVPHLEGYLDTRMMLLLDRYAELQAGLDSAAQLFAMAARSH
jgi:hypothetical protein